MIYQLLADDIVKHWDLIKFGALKTTDTPNEELFCLGLLKNLLSNKNQAWLYMGEGRSIKSLIISAIIKDVGDVKHLSLPHIYAYQSSTIKEQNEVMESMIKFAKELKLASIIGYVSDERVLNLAYRNGFKKVVDMIQLNLKE